MGETHRVVVRVIPRMRTKRGRQWPKKYRASCSCGWRGPGRPAYWEASFDKRAHRDGWGNSECEHEGCGCMGVDPCLGPPAERL